MGALSIPVQADFANLSAAAPDTMLANTLGALGVVAGIALGIVYRNLTDSREKLRKTADTTDSELRAVLTMTNDAVLLLDHRATIRGANPAAEELFGQSIDTLVGEDLKTLISHPMNIAELVRSGPACFDSATTSGDKTPVEITLSEVYRSKGASFLALIRDGNVHASTQMKPVEHPDLSAPVCKFSHDLNNVLTGIIGNLSLILMTATPDAVTTERVTGAKRSAIRAQELNRKLLALAKGEIDEAEKSAAPAPPVSTILPMPSLMILPETPAEPAAPAASLTNRTYRLLVLDDEEAICELIHSALGMDGYDVTEAYTAEDAIRACEKAVSEGRPFDLVISDLSLPGGISGEDAVRRMHEIDPKLKAIVSSGYDSDPVMSRFQDHGFCAAISKPYDINKLCRVVASTVKSNENQRMTA